jgi:tungstate transport system ATP-binding protein
MLTPDVAATPFEEPALASPAGRGLAGGTRHLCYRVGDANRVDNVDLDLAPHSLTVVMGPNGAGKSLLLRLLHGLIQPTGGGVYWGGRPLDESMRRRQAMVFQRPVLLRRSVAANIRFVMRLRGIDSPARVLAALEEVGLADRARQPARLLSGGEQQRLALARALAINPQVLFLDEPTANLDPFSMAAIESIIARVHQRGTKIVLVTHDVGQARRLADDVIFLNHGRLVEHSPAERFFTSPASAQARDYLAGRLVLT